MGKRFNQNKVGRYGRQLKRRATEPEKILMEALVEEEIWFQFQKTFYDRDRCYIVDFFFRRYNMSPLVVEVDGGSHDSERSKEYDRQRTRWLYVNRSCEVIRFKNEEVVKNVGKVMDNLFWRKVQKYDFKSLSP